MYQFSPVESDLLLIRTYSIRNLKLFPSNSWVIDKKLFPIQRVNQSGVQILRFSPIDIDEGKKNQSSFSLS